MRRSRSKLVCLAVVLAVVLSMGGSGTALAQTAGNDSAAGNAYTIHQGEECIQLEPHGDGSETVEEFYDYRNPNTTPSNYTYSSYGTTDIQTNQVSKVFVYNGSDGMSLVFLHDKFGKDDPAPYGSTITMQLSQLPDGTWAVQDDEYTVDGESQDDNWDIGGSTADIDWMWVSDRNDGGAYNGLHNMSSGDEIVIQPAFNEDAEAWSSWSYAGDADNRTEQWVARSADGTETELNMSKNVSVERTGCPDETAPNAKLDASPTTVETGDDVSFDASDSTDAEGTIDDYHWDFDGDGTVDKTTQSPTVTTTYDTKGEYPATVTVVDEAGNNDTATSTISVTSSEDDAEPPMAKLHAPEETTTGTTITLDASASSDDTGIIEYKWDFDGDGTVDRTTQSSTVDTHYDAKGDYHAAVTVVDKAGNDDTANATITVTKDEDDTTPPTAKLDAPEESMVGSNVKFDATASTDDTGIVEYRWDFDGDGDVDKTSTTAYTHTTLVKDGDFDATVTVVDAAGNTDMASTPILVHPEDHEPPTATLHVPDEVTAGDSVTVKATDVSDPSGISHICWYYDGKVGPDGKTMEVTFDETGTHTVSLRLVDGVGNEQKLTRTIEVVAPDDSDDGTDDNSDDGTDDNSDDGNDHDSDDDSNDSPDTPISNDSDDDDDHDDDSDADSHSPNVSVTSVEVSDESVEVGDDVEFTATFENTGDAEGTHNVSLNATGPGETTLTNSTNLTVPAGENRTVNMTVTFDEAGEYDVRMANHNFTITVADAETATDTATATVTPTESPTEAQGGGAPPADEGTDTEAQKDASSESGPGFGVVSVLVATIVGVLALRRRL